MQQPPKNSLSFHSGHSFHSKDTIRIPESHTLHVGPAACARRHVIKAHENHDADSVSFLALSEEDVAVGYSQQIIEAISQLNEVLETKPRLYLICVKCIDDLLGNDDQALLGELHEAFPRLRFAINHIDPIALSSTHSPSEKNKSTLYQFIEAGQERDSGITLMSPYAPIPADCEFRRVIDQWGMGPVRRILECVTYQDYQDLGKSALLLLNSPMAKHAADDLSRRLGTPLIASPLDYSPQSMTLFYRQLAQLFSKPVPPGLERWEAEAHEALASAARAVDARGLSVVVDSSAIMQPFLFAKTLLEYGFPLCCVTTKGITPLEAEAYKWVVDHSPDTLVVRTHSYKAFVGEGYPLPEDPLVIGADFARVLGVSRSVDVWHDEGLFGFQGIVKLAYMIEEAAL